MTVLAIETHQRPVPAELEQEILARIDGALFICEAELRYKLRWDDQTHGSLLEILDETRAQRADRERDPLPTHRTRSRAPSRRL